MSKKEEVKDVQGTDVAKVEETTNEVAVVEGTTNLNQLLEGLDTAETSSVTVNAESKEFEEGEVVRCIVAGHTTMTFSGKEGEEDKTKDALKFVVADGKVFICASTSLVNACRDLIEGTPIEITCTGEIKMKRGKMKTFDVRKLIFKK
jgi:hypothetical protein